MLSKQEWMLRYIHLRTTRDTLEFALGKDDPTYLGYINILEAWVTWGCEIWDTETVFNMVELSIIQTSRSQRAIYEVPMEKIMDEKTVLAYFKRNG